MTFALWAWWRRQLQAGQHQPTGVCSTRSIGTSSSVRWMARMTSSASFTSMSQEGEAKEAHGLLAVDEQDDAAAALALDLMH